MGGRAVRGDGEEVEFVEVWDEPLHERRLEVPGVVRCYEARIGEGQATAWHRHEEDCLYVSLTACEAWNEPVEAGGEGGGVLHVAGEGDVFCKHTRTNAAPYVHRVSWRGGGACRFFGIECLLPPVVNDPEDDEDGNGDANGGGGGGGGGDGGAEGVAAAPAGEVGVEEEAPAGIAEVKVGTGSRGDKAVSAGRSFASVAGTFGAAASDDPFVTARFQDCLQRVEEGCTGRFECYRLRLAPGGATPPLYWFRPGVLVSLGAFDRLSSDQVGVLGLGVPLPDGPADTPDAGACWAHKGGGGVARLTNQGDRLVRALLVLLK